MITIYCCKSNFNSTFQDADKAVEDIFASIKSGGIKIDDELNFILQFALRELFNNAVEHGNNFNVQKKIAYKVDIREDMLRISVTDGGKGFDLGCVIEREHEDSLTRDRNRGLSSLIDMGFMINVCDSCINAELYLNKYTVRYGRNDEKMNTMLEGKTLILTPDTDLIAVNVKDLMEFTKSKLEEQADYDEIIIDLSSSENIDSMGITFLIGVYKTAVQKEKKVIIKGASPAMINLFRIMKLDEIFEVE
ncbi:STAS domain-containing protein [Pseudobacteroides cellulosolvens]|uniref:Anti-sigma-factor antagonist n=1 Tax=Pseudobacteroides cellulosolvens ATCC 35603 = DSM 2933 TaxID=398512 RepID=A0A0L6JUN0_9FIRM|nr:STAS domain-containing protein [Pseudobacteroides cellulosolvens]KNY29561.1 anti-sigma-factor antagonist [Pseudobacteroides cellulosolvens ATCC 35603 = DSM 2933]